LPNKIIHEALRAQKIAELADYDTIRPEQKYGANSRVDFLLSASALPEAYVEVKNVHLWRSGDWAEFPDTVTARGLKHLGVLGDMAEAGHRAVLIYCVQHTGCARFRLAADLDPAYAEACKRALQRGVEMLCYSCAVSCEQITLARALPLDLPNLEQG
jgi:sugar fermentation stimulation protein A